MDLVDREGSLRRLCNGPAGDPRLVRPGEGLVRHDDGGRGGAKLHGEAEGIRLLAPVPVRAADFELVEVAGTDCRNEQLPRSRGAPRTHRVDPSVPAIHGAAETDAFRVGCPDREAGPLQTFVTHRGRTEDVLGPELVPLEERPDPAFVEHGGKPVGILPLPGVAVRVDRQETVIGGVGEGGQLQYETALGVHAAHRLDFTVENDLHALRPRQEDSDLFPRCFARLRRVDTEEVERRRLRLRRQRLEDLLESWHDRIS